MTLRPVNCPLCDDPMLEAHRLTETKPFMFVCAKCAQTSLLPNQLLRIGFIHGWEACRSAGYSAIGDIPKPEKQFKP